MELENKLKEVLSVGWKELRIEKRGSHFLGYGKRGLVADILVLPQKKFSFFFYGSGIFGAVSNIPAALDLYKATMQLCGWEWAIKGGNPILEGNAESDTLRDFRIPISQQLEGIRDLVVGWVAKKYPQAKIREIVLYGGMAWHLASGGQDGLGIRDIDVNIFFEAGGPKSLAWITQLKYDWNGVERKVDVYWNTLRGGQSVEDYVQDKMRNMRKGRWLTIVERPWISLLSGKIVRQGEQNK